MKLTTPRPLIELGGCLRTLVAVQTGDRADGDRRVLHVLGSVRSILEDLDYEVSLVTYNQRLANALLSIHEQVQRFPGSGNFLTAANANAIREGAVALEQVILSEAETRKIGIPEDARFKFDTLIRTPQNLLRQGMIDRLSPQASRDFRDGCRSLAFQCPTASAFHILRCIEECVRVIYRSYFPRKDSSRAWGVLCNELKNKSRNPKPSELLIAQLDHIRSNFRNPTQHPEMFYTLDDAAELLFSSLEVIGRCLNDPVVMKRAEK